MPLTNRAFDICPGKYLGATVSKYPIFAVAVAGALGARAVDNVPALIPLKYTVNTLPVVTTATCVQVFILIVADVVTTYGLTPL